MKITVEISGPLLREARNVARREGITLRSLIERGLQRVVTPAQMHAPFRLRRASFKGKGLRPKLRRSSWSLIRALSHERCDS